MEGWKTQVNIRRMIADKFDIKKHWDSHWIADITKSVHNFNFLVIWKENNITLIPPLPLPTAPESTTHQFNCFCFELEFKALVFNIAIEMCCSSE